MNETVTGGSATATGGSASSSSYSSAYVSVPGQHFQAPEIDPASSIAAITLMVGSLLVLRGRRVQKI